MEAMDNEDIDIDRTIHRICYGVMHHPGQREHGRDGVKDGRQMLFKVVDEWWNEGSESRREDYREKLSRRGVENGENHKEGVVDTGHGHGCVGKLKMRKTFGEPSGGLEDKIAEAAATTILEGASGAFSGMIQQSTGIKVPEYKRQQEQRQESGGGGLLGTAGSLLGGMLGGRDNDRDESGGRTETRTEYQREGDRYAQDEYRETSYNDGGHRSEHRRFEQEDTRGGHESQGYGYEEVHESRRTEHGYEEHQTRREYHGSTEEDGRRQHGGYEQDDGGRRHHGGYEQDDGGRRHHGGHDEDDGERRHRRRDDEEEERGGGGGFGDLLGNVVRGAEQAFGDRRH